MIFSKDRVKTPIILQMEAAECGAAALAIVLGYYGLYIPLEKIREECGVSRDGSNAVNILKASRTYGMEAKGIKLDLEDLDDVPKPIILHWDFNHFLVLEGMDKDRVYLNDPAIGSRSISRAELGESFTGVALDMRPGPDFRPGGRSTTLGETLYPLVAKEKRPIIFLIITGFALLIPGIVIPAMIQIFIDDILSRNNLPLLVPLLEFLALVIAILAVSSWLREFCMTRWQVDLSFRLSKEFFYKLFSLPLSFFDQRYAGEIATRISLNDQVAQLISGKAAGSLLDLIVSVIFLIILFLYNPTLTVIVVLITVADLFWLWWQSGRQIELSRKLMIEEGRLKGVAISGIFTIESLKAGGNESAFFEKWAGFHARYINGELASIRFSTLSTIVPTFINSIGTAAILAAGSLMIISHTITTGALFAYLALFALYLLPIQRLVFFGNQLTELEGSLQRLADVERNVPEISGTRPEVCRLAAGRETIRKLHGFLEFSELSFGYSPLETPIINGFSFALTPGRWTALVGPSGSGKSTIARLAGGLYKPWSGTILIDNLPLDRIPRSIRSLSVSIVSQETAIFEGTVRENITLWDSTISERDYVQAALDAEIHETIASLAGGYDHPLSEGGRNLSGGQRQRLEIARALASNPTLLVMDEATSALDPDTENRIIHNIRRRGCSCLVIAHRLSTIRDCDEILLMQKGSVIERGTHQQLMNAKGGYYALIRADETDAKPGSGGPA